MKTHLRKLTVIALLVAAGTAWLAGTRSWAFDWTKPFQTAAVPKAPVVLSETPIVRDPKAGSSYAPVVKKAAPSVVYISTSKTVRAPQMQMPFMDDEMLRRFFGDRFSAPGRRQRQYKETGLGSGVIVSKDGYLLTNNHVVDGADEIKVTLAGKEKKEYTAKVIGRDPKTDIAVLKIDAKDLPVITMANSDKLEVGDVVLAIGNPFGVGQAVTMGIISALGRGGLGIEEYEDFIQTDAAINPGNSGGALVDTEGRLVGINTAILSRSGGNMGVGFAVPANLARNIMDRLLQGGKVTRGFLGVWMQELDPELAKVLKVPDNTVGVVVGDVTEKSSAAAAGIKPKDIITELNGKPMHDPRELKLAVGELMPGQKVEVKVLRQGVSKNFTVTLKDLDGEQASTGGGGSHSEGDIDALDGVTVGDIDAQTREHYKLPAEVTKGAVITAIEPDSTSAEAGLHEGDVVLEIEDKAIANAEQAVEASKHCKSKRVLVRVWSNGGKRYVVVDETKKK